MVRVDLSQTEAAQSHTRRPRFASPHLPPERAAQVQPHQEPGGPHYQGADRGRAAN